MHRPAARFLPALAFVLAASSLQAQALSGLVRLAPSGAAAGRTLVLALSEGALVVASAHTDATGVFAMQLGQPGTYRLMFVRARSEPVATPAFVADASTDLERAFEIPGDSAIHDSIYLATEVTTPAAAVRFIRAPDYPEREARAAIGGRARVVVVVDADGHVDDRTFGVVGTTREAFAEAARRPLRETRYTPARIDGRAVPQLIEVLYDFGCQDRPVDGLPAGTVVIRTFAQACREAR
jgi:TonB family protein